MSNQTTDDGFLRQILENPEILDDLDNVEIMVDGLRRGNPYGIIPSESDGYINLSITNLREKYLEAYTMTSLLSFLYRSLDEWEYQFSDEEYDEMRSMPGQRERDIYKSNKNKEFQQSYKAPVKEFLDSRFEFNPEIHVRAVVDDKKSLDDPKHRAKADLHRQAMVNSKCTEALKDVLVNAQDRAYADIKAKYLDIAKQYDQLAELNKVLLEVTRTIKSLFSADQPSPSGLDDIESNLLLSNSSTHTKRKAITPMIDTLRADDLATMVNTNPPVDIFHKWKAYSDLHYESIRDVVDVLYAYKPDLEYAILPYEKFNTEDEARVHRYKYEKDVITSVYTVKCGQWSFLGPFRQNRERQDFYNKETAVIYDILDTQKKEGELAKEILKKKVKSGKLKNVKESGPDDKGLSEYADTINMINSKNEKLASYNVKPQLSEKDREEMRELVKDRDDLIEKSRAMEMDAVPENSVQVDFYRTDKDGKFTRTIAYTQADTPEEIAQMRDRAATMVADAQAK